MEQEKRQKEITRHGLIRVGLWLGGGWLLLVLLPVIVVSLVGQYHC